MNSTCSSRVQFSPASFLSRSLRVSLHHTALWRLSMRHARCMRSRCSRGRGLSACGSAVCELTPRRLPHCPAGAEVCGRDALVLQPLALDLGVRQLLGQVVAVLDHAGDLPVALPQPGPCAAPAARPQPRRPPWRLPRGRPGQPPPAPGLRSEGTLIRTCAVLQNIPLSQTRPSSWASNATCLACPGT